MAELLFKLNGVPEDEAFEVRTLLVEADIDFYETHAGNWGVSLAAIWLKDDSQLLQAKALLEEYQAQRLQFMREHARENPPEKLMQRLLRHPLQMLAILLFVGVILYVSIVPLLTAWS
jgi:hypothetical protein